MPGRKVGNQTALALTGLQTDAPIKHVQNKVFVQESGGSIYYQLMHVK